LAEIAANNLNLDKKEKIELMVACLYHDIASPPFAHATEDVFRRYFGFDHEQQLYDLMTGKTTDPLKERFQIFEGRSLKLHKIIQKKASRELGLDLFEIADIALGKGELGSLVKSTVDLDNMDNVIRAGKAFGFRNATGQLAESLASSFKLYEGKVALSEEAFGYLERWQKIRYDLYTLIYNSIRDFSLEAMIKHAIRILIEHGQLRKEDWCLTEQQLLYSKFSQDPKTREILRRIRLADPYSCISVFFITCEYPTAITDVAPKLEAILEEFLKIKPIVINYFIDRRWREREIAVLHRPLTTFIDKGTVGNKIKASARIIMGVFTPERRNILKVALKNVSDNDLEKLIFSCLPHVSEVHFHQTINNLWRTKHEES
jgi:HD superfamily phosphohydrolase